MKEFKVKGRDGLEHKYVHTALEVDDSITIGLSLAPVLGGPIGKLIEGLAMGVLPKLKEAQSQGATNLFDIELKDMVDIGSVIESMEWGDIGASLGRGVTTLTPSLIRRMLKTCSRDGSPLSNRSNFDNAFKGNPIELTQALGKVLVLEGYVDFGSTSTSGGSSEGE